MVAEGEGKDKDMASKKINSPPVLVKIDEMVVRAYGLAFIYVVYVFSTKKL